MVSLAEAALVEAIQTAVPKPPDVGAIFARQKALNVERETLRTRQQQLDNDARFKRGEAERYRSEASLGEIDITQGRIRVCPVCRVSIDEIKANGCGISLEPCDLAALKSAVAAKHKKATDLDNEAGGAEQESKIICAQIQQLEPKRLALEAEVKDADDATRAAQVVTKEIQGFVAQIP